MIAETFHDAEARELGSLSKPDPTVQVEVFARYSLRQLFSTRLCEVALWSCHTFLGRLRRLKAHQSLQVSENS